MSAKRTGIIKAVPTAMATEPDKAAKVEQERTRLMELFAGADVNKLDFIRDHVQQLAWLGITIIELQAEIDEKGSVMPFINGENQRGYQANPACKTLKDFQTLYNAQFKALLPVLPEKVNGFDELDEFRTRPRTQAEIEAEEAVEEARQKRIKEEIAAVQKKLDAMHAKHGQ